MIIKPLKIMRYRTSQFEQERMWREQERQDRYDFKRQELESELQHEDRSWSNQQQMKEIHRRRAQVELERLNKTLNNK